VKHFRSYLDSAKRIIDEYSPEEPFALHLKKFFKINKKYGSRDRKAITQLCYSYFRTGKAMQNATPEEILLTGFFLTTTSGVEMIQALRPSWMDRMTSPIEEKIRTAGIEPTRIFPWSEQLSDGIDHFDYCLSFLVQPDLFLRVRPGHYEEVKSQLHKAQIAFKEIKENALAIANSSSLDKVIDLDKDAIVQDLNSQHVLDSLEEVSNELGHDFSVWDCCAASGGKSIQLHDKYPGCKLTVSDIRESILINLRKRFARAGINNYQSFVADLKDKSLVTTTKFQLIMADVPCTGSGTWSRTPEQLFYFKPEKITEYASLQKKITANIVAALNENGYLLYSTCSVFKQENEDIVHYLSKESKLQILSMKVLKGYDQKADTMFSALLSRR
jgi:16S rRNA (cytosine967-C5)-methyltransferase